MQELEKISRGQRFFEEEEEQSDMLALKVIQKYFLILP